MGKKIFKTLDEQVEILKNKGLVIDNVDYAKEILLRENYFFLNGYRHLFMKSSDNSMYIPGTKIEELYSLFLFDRKIRNIFFKNILIVENNVKSIISYQLSKKYGYKEKDYLNPNNFVNNGAKRKQVSDLISKMKRQIKTNAVQHAATQHYVNNYGYIPLWVLVKVLSFGIVSELFSVSYSHKFNDIWLRRHHPKWTNNLHTSMVRCDALRQPATLRNRVRADAYNRQTCTVAPRQTNRENSGLFRSFPYSPHRNL